MNSGAETSAHSPRKASVWRSNHTCMICQDLCRSSEEKKNHEKQPQHKKKLLIYDFFAKEVPKCQPFNGPSILMRRYISCGEQAIGLECLHELHFSFTSLPWWACSICYESGAQMEQADMHLSSLSHISTYLDEFHSSKFDKNRMDGDPLKVFDEVKCLCDKVFEEQGRENLPPECLVMSSVVTEAEAMAKLAIESADLKPSYKLYTDCCNNETARKILQCLICHELVACNDEMLKRIWNTHELSPGHRRAVAVRALLEQFQVEYAACPDTLVIEKPFTWRAKNGHNYGPVCGIKYLVAFNKGNFCRLCWTPVKSIEDHFSSEYHIMQFLAVSYPVEMFQFSQYGQNSRLNKSMKIVSKRSFRLENGQIRKVPINWFPHCLKVVLKRESHDFPGVMKTLSPFGIDSKCLFCPVCLLTLNVAKDVKDNGEAVWNAHCEESSHFEFAVRRACFSFDEKFFVPVSSSVSRAPRVLHGQWCEIKEGNKVCYMQTQRDVGLEYLVDDQESKEVVCTLCAQWFPRQMETLINNHIRSYAHFYHYLHVNNRNLLSMVLMQKTAETGRELMLEWLQRSSYNEFDEMRSYSPETALQMLRWGSIIVRKVDAASYDSQHRPVFECVMAIVDKVAGDDVGNAKISVKEALVLAGVRILTMKRKNGNVERLLCRCTQCGMVFSTAVETIVTNVWDNHLSSQQHFARLQAFTTNKLDMLGFSENTSSYTVKPFKQEDPSNTVTWQWNLVRKEYEFVLSVIGLEDLVERRSSDIVGVHSPDFFCKLCAVVIPRHSSTLEAHVRSTQHVLCYVHKYHPNTIMEIDALPKPEGKEMRRILTQLLKSHNPKDLYSIPIYDPVGEQKRKSIIAMRKAKDEERQRQLEDIRKRAQEQRKKKDEERRRQREIEIRREKIRQAEIAWKEKESRERAKRREQKKAIAEKQLHESVRNAKVERQVRNEREREVEEAEREAEEAERLRRQDRLRNFLDEGKQRLKALQEKEATQRHLRKEKDKLERKIHEMERRREDTAVHNKIGAPVQETLYQNNISTPVQDSVYQNNIPALVQDTVYQNHITAPVQDTMHMSSLRMRSPPVYPVNPSYEFYPQLRLASAYSDMQVGPVPPPTVSFSFPVDGIRRPQESGSQAMFKTFVPLSESFPEHAKQEEKAEVFNTKADHGCQNIASRPSLRDRKVDPYISNGKIIQSRDQLVDFIWRQGAERIPANELPVKFNEKAAEIEGALGIDSLYEVVCVDCSDLDTFYCSMCGVWTTPSDMFEHLGTTGHKLAYLFRNYKMYHQTIISESNFLARSAMLNKFAIKIWKMEKPPGKVSNRLRSLLDRATIERIWPEYITVLDQSWKENGGTVGRVEVPPPISKKVLSLIDEESADLKEKGKHKNKKQSERTVSVKERDNRSSNSKKRGKGNDEKVKEESSRLEKHISTSEKPKQRGNRKQVSPSRKRHRSRSSERRSTHSHRRLRDLSSGHSKHKRQRSRSRSRSRRRSRSPNNRSYTSRRTSRRSRSRSPVGNAFENSGLSWEATAAAFLTKLGDPHGAARVSQPSNNSNIVDEKTKQWRGFAESQLTEQTSSLLSEFLENQERLKKLQSLSAGTDTDEKAQMRKLLGVLITMQQEAEKHGSLDKSVVDRLYKEVGLKKSVDSSDQLLVQLCSQISSNNDISHRAAVDLQSFGINTGPENVQSQASSPVFYGGFHQQPRQNTTQSHTSLIQTLLNEVKRSLSKLKPPQQLSPVVSSSPFTITSRDDIFPCNETIPCVYPGADSTSTNGSHVGRSSNSGISLPSFAVTEMSRNEKASMRRETFQDVEQLRKQAGDGNTGMVGVDEDDDWDCLAEVINGPSVSNNDFQSSSKSFKGYKCDTKNDLKTPIAPGQKMPLPRTILPSGELLQGTLSMQHKNTKGEESNAAVAINTNTKPKPSPQPLLSLNLEPNVLLQSQQHTNAKGEESNAAMAINTNTGIKRIPQDISFLWRQPSPQPLLSLHLEPNTLLQSQQRQQQYCLGQEVMYEQQQQQQQQTLPDYGVQQIPQQPFYVDVEPSYKF